MTLVIAGHDIEKSNARDGYAVETSGLFVVADSTITSDSQTLLNGFKKIYHIPIKVYKPSFLGPYFHNYLYELQKTNCFIAFAGSTLTAQHVLNGIGNHLSKLRVGYENGYKILMKCEQNSLEQRQCLDKWDEDMFCDDDIKNLLSGDVVSNAVHHSITSSLAGAKKYKIDKRGWESLLTQYVLGTFCQVQKRHRLYAFIPQFRKNMAGEIEGINVNVKEIAPGELAVLGMQKFTKDANEKYIEALRDGQDVKIAIFSFLNSAIDEVQNQGNHEIDRPAILSRFHQGVLSELKRED